MGKPNTICRVCGREYYCCEDSRKIGSYHTMACSPACYQEYMRRIEFSRNPGIEAIKAGETNSAEVENSKGGQTTVNVYLDHAASTPLSDSMKQYLSSVLDLYGNPSSLHSVGEAAKQIISAARQKVAGFINANAADIYFTPSGSASNTLAIKGYYAKHNRTILYSPIAHKSILKCVQSLKKAYPLKVDHNGFIDLDNLNKRLDSRNMNPFIMIDYANSEIGTVQNVKELIDLTHFHNGVIYLDCTGSLPAIPMNVENLNADMVGFSAHKLGGLKGCGVLYKKKNIELEPLIYGSQEQEYVGGTENTLGIASLSKAVEEYDYSSISPSNRNYIYDYMISHIPDCYLVGASIASGNRLPNNLYMCFKGTEGNSLMMMLDMNNIQVSTGSACSSVSLTPSSTLTAIGLDQRDIHSCIRMTFSGKETKEELDYVCRKIKESVHKLRNLNNK